MLGAHCKRSKAQCNLDLVHLIEYLHDPKFLDRKKDLFGMMIKKKSIHDHAVKLICKLYAVKEEESDVDNEFVEYDVYQ